jgi:hypothetical protein
VPNYTKITASGHNAAERHDTPTLVTAFYQFSDTIVMYVQESVAELHHFDAAPAPTLQHTKATF